LAGCVTERGTEDRAPSGPSKPGELNWNERPPSLASCGSTWDPILVGRSLSEAESVFMSSGVCKSSSPPDYCIVNSVGLCFQRLTILVRLNPEVAGSCLTSPRLLRRSERLGFCALALSLYGCSGRLSLKLLAESAQSQSASTSAGESREAGCISRYERGGMLLSDTASHTSCN
jgi:hypothetical protein